MVDGLSVETASVIMWACFFDVLSVEEGSVEDFVGEDFFSAFEDFAASFEVFDLDLVFAEDDFAVLSCIICMAVIDFEPPRPEDPELLSLLFLGTFACIFTSVTERLVSE